MVFRFKMTDLLLDEAKTSIQTMSEIITLERFPDPTPVRARCTDCEYRNFCGDVF
jgi:CRISPR/Cas system-associated exonuclease Cas4 (RecB family)